MQCVLESWGFFIVEYIRLFHDAVLLLHGSFENIFQEKIYSLHNIERLFYEIKKYSRRRGSYFKQ